MTADDVDLNYGSIGTLLSALHARKVSASELLAHTIARIEALDGLDQRRSSFAISIGRETPHAPPNAGRWTAERRLPLLGIHKGSEGTVQRRRPADDMGLSAFQGFPTGGRRPCGLAVEGGRRHHHRQDQYPDRLAGLPGLQRHLRSDEQPMGTRPDEQAAPRAARGAVLAAGLGPLSSSARTSAARSRPRGTSVAFRTQAGLRPGPAARLSLRVRYQSRLGRLAVVGADDAHRRRHCAVGRHDCRPRRDARRDRRSPWANGPAAARCRGFLDPA